MTETTQIPTSPHAAGQRPGWADELSGMMQAYQEAGGNPEAIRLPDVATLVVSANNVLMAHEIPGVRLEAEPLEHGVKANIIIEPGAQIEQPIHLCFGLLPAEGLQEIIAGYEVGAGAKVKVLAHCSFPNAVKIQHVMQGSIHVGANAELTYTEEHFHGTTGGIEVRPTVDVTVDEGGRFNTTFSLTRGRVGLLALDYHIRVAARGVTEMITKAYGSGDDQIHVQEVVTLDGAEARGLTRSRIAVRDQATSRVDTTTEGNAPGARGHMDCTEIIRGKAVASNNPLVVVRDDHAQVTHEAAIGTVNRKELETLMARGLSEDDAVDLIIRGMVR